MSAASDRFESDVAKYIDSIPGMSAIRPSVGTQYSDVKITKFNTRSVNEWVEVKMNHTDNLANPRVFYANRKWQTTYKTPTAHMAVDILNRSNMARQFVKDIAAFSGIPEDVIIIPTGLGDLKKPGAVPLDVMKKYFDQPGVTRYIAQEQNVDMGKVVTDHYTIGKAEPAYYMQAGDDFYLISNKNPLKLSNRIPVLGGTGDFKVRVSTRSRFYEVQAEVKIAKFKSSSDFSLKPGTKKQNPFLR